MWASISTAMTSKYKRGKPLTVREAKLLQVGDVVWFSAKEDDLSSWRVSEAVTIDEVIRHDPTEFDFCIAGFKSSNMLHTGSCDEDQQVVDEYHSWAGLWHVVKIVS